MASFRSIGGSRTSSTALPRRDAVRHVQERKSVRASLCTEGSLACARCDAPVAIGPAPLSLTVGLSCPFCGHHGPVRDFLSLARPTRPARVLVRVTTR